MDQGLKEVKISMLKERSDNGPAFRPRGTGAKVSEHRLAARQSHLLAGYAKRDRHVVPDCELHRILDESSNVKKGHCDSLAIGTSISF